MQQPMSAITELRQVLSTPPPDWNQHNQQHAHNPIAVAHASLQALRDSGDDRCLFIRSIFELVAAANRNRMAGQDEELLFHCITGCRHVLLSKYSTTSSLFINPVRDYFMALGYESYLSRTIRLACYNASASVWKRGWNNENSSQQQRQQQQQNTPLRPEEQAILELMNSQQTILQQGIPQLKLKNDLFHHMQNMLASPGPQMEAAASYLICLVGEFAGKSASHYRMALEFHKRAHASFEKEGWLDQTLQLAMKSLSQVVSMIAEHQQQSATTEELEMQVVQLTIDTIGWEFGSEAWDSGIASSSTKTMIRPPQTWRDVLMQPDFVKAVFHVHKIVVRSKPKLGQCLRQLLLLLSSLSGPMFRGDEERKIYATYLLEGTLELLSSTSSILSSGNAANMETSEILDTMSLVTRLIANYRLSVLVHLPHLLQSILQGVASIGRQLLQENVRECQSAHGDLESMENREWREESLAVLLEGVVLLCSDPWLLFSGSEASRQGAQMTLAAALAPLYAEFVTCRTRMARLEEQYLATHEAELDEVHEDIYAVDLEEEMESLAHVGRLDLLASLSCLSTMFQSLTPQLESLWGDGGNGSVVSPEAAGLLEESRLVTMYIGHLLTDDNSGETPVIPDSIIVSCQSNDAVTGHISSAVQTLLHFAEVQASMIAAHPSDLRLSPLLAKSLLWFLIRWGPAYILPVDYGAGSSSSHNGNNAARATQSGILKVWSSPESVQQTVNFCVTLCLHYICYWPQERQVQDNSAVLLFSLAKRCKQMRDSMVNSPTFVQLVRFHCLTAGIRHSAPPAEFESTIQSKFAGSSKADVPSMVMVRGYQRLPYDVKAKVLTALLVGCSEHEDPVAKAMLEDCLKAIQDAFASLVNVLSTKQASPESVDAKEMANLCVELFGGVARAGDMVASERIPKFVSPSLPHLSSLMVYYAEDLSICESLLRLFHDYAEQFIAILDPQACLVLFQSSAELLKSYSAHHCKASRVVIAPQHAAEEEQNYSDVLCAIQLLIQLGTKDFIDIGGDNTGVESGQVTQMIFFGLQQILPLMTKGLLQFPSLCGQYFSLVGFMMETYPDKVAALQYELFDALLESLLFGMSHHDSAVAKCSLQGLAGLLRNHLESKSLDQQLATSMSSNANNNNNGGKDGWLLDKVSRRLLADVVFQNAIWDRIEAAGLALLPLVAVDLQRFAAIVQQLTKQVPVEHQHRLSQAFERLLVPEVVSKVASRGYEGRQNRIKFKKDFEEFCHEIHSFLIIR